MEGSASSSHVVLLAVKYKIIREGVIEIKKRRFGEAGRGQMIWEYLFDFPVDFDELDKI